MPCRLRKQALGGFGQTHLLAIHQAFVRAGSAAATQCLARWPHLPLAESAGWEAQLHICYHGSGSSVAHRWLGPAARQGRTVRRLPPAESLQSDRGRQATLHRDVGSSRWFSTSCSTARERITSRAPLSAASITCDTSARTFREISGFHLLSFVSSFSAMASTDSTLRHPCRQATRLANFN